MEDLVQKDKLHCVHSTVACFVLEQDGSRGGDFDMREHSHSMQLACGAVEYIPFHFSRAQMLNSCIQRRIVLKL